MAITVVKNPSSLKLKFDCGKDDKGKSIMRTKSFSYLKYDADATSVFNVAVALASLQKNVLLDVVKADNSNLSQ